MARSSASLHLPAASVEQASATPTTGGRASHVRWRIFAVIFALTMVNLIDRVSLSIAMPTIAHEFSLSPSLQGLILSSFFWAYALLQIPGGWLIDRFGPHRVIGWSTGLWGTFQVLAAFATGGLSLLFARVALGAAEAPLFPSGGKLISLWLAPGERSRGAVLMDSGSASAPLPPPLFSTTVLTSSSLWVAMIDWISRASWSVPPPGPPATTISRFLSGCQAWARVGSVPTHSRVQPRSRRDVRRTNVVRMGGPRVLVVVMSGLSLAGAASLGRVWEATPRTSTQNNTYTDSLGL